MWMQTERCGRRSQNMVTARNVKEWDLTVLKYKHRKPNKKKK
jgi:hypothetical protein